jgi:glycosyltransferase involved in cell wall biosynthesis
VSALVTVSQPLADRLKAVYRNVPIHVAVTGFDPELYARADPQLSDKFLVLYAGRVWPEQDPRRFLVPLANAIDSGRVDPARTRVELLSMGTLGPEDRAFIRHRGLEGVVEELDFVPRDEVIDRERTAQVLLHLRWDDPEETGILTGKIFEYLAARRPILSTGLYKDAVSALLEETGAGVASNSDEEAEAFLVQAYEAFASKGRVPYEGRQDVVDRYDARRTAATVAAILEEAVAHKGKA